MSEEGGPKKLTAIDLFAGGGGASLGLSRAGLTVTHAVNHWDDALDVHELNHPEAEHHLENVWRVDPRGVSVDVLWASPDCTHFSRAKGEEAAVVTNEDAAVLRLALGSRDSSSLRVRGERAQGFPDDYVIDRGRQKSAMTRTTQVRIVGNSVCHDVAYALVRANVFGDVDAGEC